MDSGLSILMCHIHKINTLWKHNTVYTTGHMKHDDTIFPLLFFSEPVYLNILAMSLRSSLSCYYAKPLSEEICAALVLLKSHLPGAQVLASSLIAVITFCFYEVALAQIQYIFN